MLTHERPYPCYECTKAFKSETLLNKHISNEHNETIFYVEDVDLQQTEEEVFILGNTQ